jgi:hypothetical protein
MAGGGVVIIRRKVRETAELEIVRSSLHGWKQTRYDTIMGKDAADWTEHEFDFVQRCISDAHDANC